ncbi:TIR domain-containing adapter molecule 1 [Paroedura picta]|uniref:TIR domain-containing adapter molecule 1 n=1 Tax=Paroedura picta TaxID=143630 RepID=UPI004056CC5A
MAANHETQPSFEQVADLLAQIPQDKLILLKHKLNCVRQDTRSCRLLQAMVLLALSREAEAREILGTFKEDVAAAHICRSHWGSSLGSSLPLPTQEAQVVAQMYSLLAEEKLCSPQARDEAYRAAIEAFRSQSGVQHAKLDALLAEAQEKCGLGFATGEVSGVFNILRSGPERLPRSMPLPINGSLALLSQPLRSTGSPTSIVSHFEISPSPTVPYIHPTTHQPGVSEVSRLCGGGPSSLAQPGEGSISVASPPASQSEIPGVQELPRSCLDVSCRSHWAPNLEKSPRSPVEYTEPSAMVAAAVQDPQGGTPPNMRTACRLQAGLAAKGCVQTLPKDSPSPCPSPGPEHASSSSDLPPATAASSTDSPGNEDQFFMFVVVHANEDERIACRVRDLLEKLGVRNGATFCEDFLVPGHSQLACFQDALDNSAFTLLLLTEHFKSHLCTFQTNMALMNSFTHFVKTNSVIPFIPKECPLKKEEMPMTLAGLVPLVENSRVFEKTVKNTFKLSEFEKKKFTWGMKQQLRRQERLREESQDHWQIQQQLLALGLQPNYPAQVPFPSSPNCFPGLCQVPPGPVPPPFLSPTSFMPGMHQPSPGLGQAAPFHPFPVSLPAPLPQGPQPHLIIQHAQMIQIGDCNHMQVERSSPALGMAEDQTPESQGAEAEARHRHGD